MTVAEQRKRAKHQSHCDSAGIDFMPLVLESFGGWGEEAIATLKKIAVYLPTVDPTTKPSRHLFQRLAITLQRGNASLWLRRSPNAPPIATGLR